MALQGLQFDTAAWAKEYFNLHGEKATAKLQKYRHLNVVNTKIPNLSELSSPQQLEMVVALIAEQAKEWVDSLLGDMSALNIQQVSSQPAQTAEATVQMFQEGTSHALQAWADSEAAPQHLSSFLGSLGLEPIQVGNHLAAVVCAIHGSLTPAARHEQELQTLIQVQTA